MSRSRSRRSGFRFLAWLFLPPATLVGLLWFYGPWLIGPTEEFAQGPGAAIAYVSLANQLKKQDPMLLRNREIRFTLNGDEFSGLISSALLSGKSQGNPVQKVRANLSGDEMQIEMVLQVAQPEIPTRFQGPIGLVLWLRPAATTNGVVELEITRAKLGRIPVSPEWIRRAGRWLTVKPPSFDPETPAVRLPLGGMLGNQLGRVIQVKQVQVENGQLLLTGAIGG